jgi:RND family efflux transporter MFP subunit
LQSYERITAPFTGTVTQRNLDVGTLVSPGTGGTSGGTPAGSTGQGLFRIAQTDTMRVYVNVPQAMAPAMRPGLAAKVTLQEQGPHAYVGKVVRTADAIDPTTRTLLVEVQVPNPDRSLLSGSYAQVGIDPGASILPITVPANALLFDAKGTRVATLDEHNVVHFHNVQVGRDYGAAVEILSGIPDGATVVLNPSDDLHDGSEVKPVRLTDADTKGHARPAGQTGR